MIETAYIQDMAVMADYSISENIGETEEGYLICYNVPVARTGTQEYLGREIGLLERPNDKITVHRLPEDVFSKEAMRSAEGKVITDDHPPVMVTMENHHIYDKGHAQNVRRAANYLIMDLIITDPNLAEKIRNGKREVSLGYHCVWVPLDNDYKQTKIRVNHIAIVDHARAGRKAAIRDSVDKREIYPMNDQQLKASIFAAYVKDTAATPDSMAKAMELLNYTPTAHHVPVMDEDSLVSKIAKIFKGEAKDEETKEDERMQKLEDELKELKDTLGELNAATEKEIGDEEEKETEDEDVEEYNEDEAECEDEEEAEAKDAYDSIRKQLAPVLKTMPAKQQKAVKDAMRKGLGLDTSNENYKKVKKTIQDAKVKQPPVMPEDVGRKIRDAFNPQYKNKPESIFS